MLTQQRKRIMEAYMGKLVHVVVDRPVGYRHGDIVYPINYGYIPGVMADDGEEQDVYILGISEPITEFDGQVVAAIYRENDCEDKLVVAPEGQIYHQGQIAEAVHFQEQYFCSRIVTCFEKSCGVLPYRTVNGQREFLLVFESYSQCWSIPKGHIEMGETEIQTAQRELLEETGLTATLDTSRCASIEYPVSQFARKEVAFYLGEVDGEPKVREGEIDRYKWVTAEELRNYLFPDTYAACLKLLRESVRLEPMNREMCHRFYQGFQNDPAIGHYYEYVYTPEIADAYYDRNTTPDRMLFAIMIGDQIVGECKLKDIDAAKRECSMGIHLQNDAVKGKGYGTQAERLILQYAFEELGMVAVNADAALCNSRSQHVLEKVGFRYTHQDDTFRFYRCERKETKNAAQIL